MYVTKFLSDQNKKVNAKTTRASCGWAESEGD
jgi:hypothetical protein